MDCWRGSCEVAPDVHRRVAVKLGWRPNSATKIRATVKEGRLRQANDSSEPDQSHQRDELRGEWRKGFDDPDSFDFEAATLAQAKWQSERLGHQTQRSD